jgi:Dolichyl-phosphate-mannose-protein mannosyltransferase
MVPFSRPKRKLPIKSMCLSVPLASQLSAASSGEDGTWRVHGRCRDVFIASLVFVCSGAYLFLFYNYANLNGDEGIILQGAQRILDGQVLYRDFFSFYTPGSYYLTALLFKLFGSSILTARAGLVLCGAIFSTLTYVLARRVSSTWSSLLAVYLLTVTCMPFRFLVSHWDSTLFAYLALYCAVLWVEQPRHLWAFMTASFVSLTCLFEQSKGAGLLIGTAAGVLVIVRNGRWHFSLGSTLATFAAGLITPVTVVAAYFSRQHAIRQMASDCLWPLFHYSTTNKVSYGLFVMSSNFAGLSGKDWKVMISLLVVAGPLILIPLLPILSVGILAWYTLARPEGERNWSYWIITSTSLSGLLLATVLTGRADFTHLNYVAPLYFPVLAWLVDGLPARSDLWRRAMPVVVLYITVSCTAFGIAMLWAPLGAHTEVKTARGTVKVDSTETTLQYVLARVNPGEQIFVYPYEPLYYYLTGTSNPTRFDFLQLGMHTEEQFQDSLAALATARPRVVLFETSFREKLSWTSPQTPLNLIAAKDPIEDYIFSAYRPCSPVLSNSYWRFLFMVRKDQPCP